MIYYSDVVDHAFGMVSHQRDSLSFEAGGAHDQGRHAMQPPIEANPRGVSRRSFVKHGAMGGVALAGLSAFAGTLPAMAATREEPGLTDGDVAILQFLAAAELNRDRPLGAVRRAGGGQ